MNEKMAVKIGIQFEKTFALLMPIFLTENAKRINAPQEAKTDNSIIGMKCPKEKEVLTR
jgi:hypothetical protein